MHSLALILLVVAVTLLPSLTQAQLADTVAENPAPVLSASNPGLTLRAAIPSIDDESVQYGQVYLVMADGKITAELKLDPKDGLKDTGKLTLNNEEDLASIVQPLAVYFEPTAGTQKEWVRKVSAMHFRPVGEWRRIHKRVAGDVIKLKPVTTANEKLRIASNSLLTNSETTDETRQHDVETFLTAVETAKNAAYAALLVSVEDKDLPAKGFLLKYISDLETDTRNYLSIKANDPAVKGALNSLSQQTNSSGLPIINKDFYGLSDNYRPEVLAMGVRWTRATVSISKLTDKVGTGALIGKNIVLTCWHCVSRGQLSDYRVEFFDDNRKDSYIEKLVQDHLRNDVLNKLISDQLPQGSRAQLPPGFQFNLQVPKQFPVKRSCRLIHKNEQLDYCLLNIGPANPDDLTDEDKEEMPPIDRLTPIVLCKSRVGFMTPLYVLGYPQGGELTVHDNSWVTFPLDIDEHERPLVLRKLAESTLPEYEPFTSEKLENLSSRYKRAHDNAKSEMKKHYPDFPTNGFYRRHYKGEAHLGLESDTFEGDSGAPVISRRLGGLIGILRRGVADTQVATKGASAYPRRITSTVHEEAIPVEIIINDIEQNLGVGWPHAHGLKSED